MLYFLFTLLLVKWTMKMDTNQFIKDYDLPVCVTCEHFIPDIGHKTDFKNIVGRCKLFGVKDIVTGIVDHHFAISCRANSELCGKNATYYYQSITKANQTQPQTLYTF
jgi:hypothetical protein